MERRRAQENKHSQNKADFEAAWEDENTFCRAVTHSTRSWNEMHTNIRMTILHIQILSIYKM